MDNFGINVFGYIDGEFGLGEAIRLLIKAIEKANIPHVLLNYDTPTAHRHNDVTYQNFSKEAPYLINLVLLGPTEARKIATYFNIDFFKNKYNIFFLNWESENLPQEYIKNLNFYDEIWTPATYCSEVVNKNCSTPTKTISYPLEIIIDNAFDLESDNFYNKSKFNFLYIFDYNSTLERKNTLNLIKAFKLAFLKDDNSVCLTIKTSRSTRFSYEKELLLAEIANYQNIKIIEKIFDKNTLHKIINGCDSYVSLHRSEGFGLTMAEAMYFGKPVIATGYSGNTEFMNSSNSFLVKYKLCKVETNIINYDTSTIWSEPDVNHAAELMQIVKLNTEAVKSIAIKGQSDIKKYFSVDEIGTKIKEEINIIYKNYKVNPYKEELIVVTIENELYQNELSKIKKSKLIQHILNIKQFFRNRKLKKQALKIKK